MRTDNHDYHDTVKEVSRKKSTSRAKLKAASQKERLKKWKTHFKNLFGNPLKITDKSIKEILNSQLDIKLRPFMKEELDAIQKKMKSRKAAGLNKISPEVWKTRKFDDVLQLCNAMYKQNTIEEWTKRLHPLLIQEK